MLILGTLSAIYIIPSIYHDYNKMEQSDAKSPDERHLPNDEKFAQNAVDNIKKKTQSVHVAMVKAGIP